MAVGLITEISVWFGREIGFAIISTILVVNMIKADTYRYIDKQLQTFAIVEKKFGHNVDTRLNQIKTVILSDNVCR